VADLLQELHERLKALGSEWATYSIIGSAALYLAGYLALRFHLTVLGIGTDLAVLDERYAFTGARFFVQVVSSIPNVLLIGALLAALGWMLSRIAPAPMRGRLLASILRPSRLALIGIVLAMVSIQFAMRQCFLVSNLLLRPALPREPAWLVGLLLDEGKASLYFDGLVAACVVSIVILAVLRKSSTPTDQAWQRSLLAFLAGVQILFLPVNYGVLIVDQTLPRVASAGDMPLVDGDEAWLVWEGKDGQTFLVGNREGTRRALITLDRSDIKRTEIIGFDPILRTLFKPGRPAR
jgi:hypothetical protein